MDIGIILTKALAFMTLIGNGATVVVLLVSALSRSHYKKLMSYLSEQALGIGFLLSSSATLGSIFYAIVVGYPACILCWTQRIFMYPMMFLLALAWWRKDRSIIPYAFLLSVLGGAVALYQWMKDMLALYTHFSLTCPVVPGVPSCDRIYVLEFGYITIPMFALNIFILIAIVMYAALRRDKIQHER